MKKVYPLEKLEEQKKGFESRIQRIEEDLRLPLDANSEEQASQLSEQFVLRRLLEVERAGLIKVNFEIEKFKLL